MIQTIVVQDLVGAFKFLSRPLPPDEWIFITTDSTFFTTDFWYRKLEDVLVRHPEAIFGVRYNAILPTDGLPQFFNETSKVFDYRAQRDVGNMMEKGKRGIAEEVVTTLRGNLLASVPNWKRILADFQGTIPATAEYLKIPMMIIPSVFMFRWREDLLC